MMNWMISANGKIYDHVAAFDEFGYIDWRQTANFDIGDVVYIYATRPYMKVKFKTVVEKINMKFEEITDDEKYWYDRKEYENSQSGRYARLRLLERADSEKLSLYALKNHGLKAAPQGPIKLKEELVEYLKANFSDYEFMGVFPEEVGEDIREGHRRSINVNRYERSSIARQKCIEEKGGDCAVCAMNFEKIYGEIGKGFIHVHHIVPLHEIKGTYQVDYKKDLVPVCPNCHAMLHRKVNGRYFSVDELRELVRGEI